jgi:hypothetical protein
VDPKGGLWSTNSPSYHVARLDARGDTTLLLEVGIENHPVTADDRRSFIEFHAERGPEYRRAAEQLADLTAEFKPAVAKLIADDEGRLWVERTMPEREPPVFDVFTRDGDYEGTFRLGFQPSPYIPIRVRRGSVYAVVPDALDVPTVVRAPLPEELIR